MTLIGFRNTLYIIRINIEYIIFQKIVACKNPSNRLIFTISSLFISIIHYKFNLIVLTILKLRHINFYKSCLIQKASTLLLKLSNKIFQKMIILSRNYIMNEILIYLIKK
jgi:hypothetical protein